jgi:hypothetical protein
MKGRCISDFSSMPQIGSIESEQIVEEFLLRDGIDQYNKLNGGKTNIVNEIINSVNEIDYRSLKYFYIDGSGGTGKTFIQIQKTFIQLENIYTIVYTILFIIY